MHILGREKWQELVCSQNVQEMFTKFMVTFRFFSGLLYEALFWSFLSGIIRPAIKCQ